MKLTPDSLVPLDAFRINGYPDMRVVIAHYDSIPILIEAVRQHCPPQVLADWDAARNTDPGKREITVAYAARKRLAALTEEE
jgi:hypothetical protein